MGKNRVSYIVFCHVLECIIASYFLDLSFSMSVIKMFRNELFADDWLKEVY